MTLRGEIWVNDESRLTWTAEWASGIEGEDGRIEDTYECSIAYEDGERIPFHVTQRRGDNAESLAVKVLLRAAWHRRAKAKEMEKSGGRRRRG